MTMMIMWNRYYGLRASAVAFLKNIYQYASISCCYDFRCRAIETA
jgi:hypothetical protein